MLTFQIFKFCFLQKVTLRVSKCITCDFSSFSCRSFSSTNNNKPRSKFLSLPTISCFDFFFGCSRDGFEELQWARAKVQKNDGTHEFKVAPNYFFFYHWEVTFSRKLVGRSWQWSRSLKGRDAKEVSAMVKVAHGWRSQGGFDDCQSWFRAKVSGRSWRWLILLLGWVIGEVFVMAKITHG